MDKAVRLRRSIQFMRAVKTLALLTGGCSWGLVFICFFTGGPWKNMASAALCVTLLLIPTYTIARNYLSSNLKK